MAQIVVISRAGAASVPGDLAEEAGRHGEVVFVRRDRAPSREDAVGLLRVARVLACTNVTLPYLDPGLLDRLPDLRHVVLYATGHEHIDVSALARRGISLSTLPDYATNAVAEHALGLIFACATRVHLANDRSRGLAAADVSLRGVEITGRTLAVVGMGRIGTRLAHLARGLGIRVIGVDTDPAACARATAAGFTVRPLAAALTHADLVAVAAARVPGEPCVLGAAELARLPRDAFVVNVGRPALVDQAAVVAALSRGALRGYAVDDVCFDPSDARQAGLIAEGRILQSAHSAWWRDEVLARGAQMFGAALVAAAAGAPIHVVAPDDATLPAAG